MQQSSAPQDVLYFRQGHGFGIDQVYRSQIFERPLHDIQSAFYEKGGQVGISYGGQELPVSYDEVIHGECCGGMNNPRFSEHMAWFYGLQDRVWYYVEIGNYD